MNDSPREHLDELLVDAAVFGLEGEEAENVRQHALALGLDPERERERWEQIAGTATSVLLTRTRQSVPETLMSKLRTDALVFYARRGRVRWDDVVKTTSPRPPTVLPSERNPWLVYIAAAAALLLAFAVFFGPSREPALDPAQARAVLLDSGAVDVRHEWKPGENPVAAGIEGDVVWSSGRQEGYLRLRGLAANDPTERQYQLWIVDGERGMPPVDGGVFDVPSGQGETIVPISAKLEVGQASLFVITVEPPGGVVVSERGERVAAVAGG